MKTKTGYALYSIPPRNMLVLCILEILRNYSDENHKLTQPLIMDYLEKDFSLKPARRTVKDNLLNLVDFGYNVKYTEIKREGGDIYTEWYLDNPFTEDELYIIYSSVLETKNLTKTEAKEIVEKLKRVLYKPIT